MLTHDPRNREGKSLQRLPTVYMITQHESVFSACLRKTLDDPDKSSVFWIKSSIFVLFPKDPPSLSSGFL